MNDSISVHSDDEERDSGWDAESEFTDYTGRSFGKGSKLDGAWSWMEDGVDFFRCGSSAHAVGAVIDMLDSLVTDAVEPYIGSCRSGRGRTAREGEGKATDSVQTETVVTPNDMSLNSILGAQPTRPYAWSSPPRLHTMVASRSARRDLERERRATSFPKILGEAFYISEVDTFLSDDLTDMEQGYFNGLYDHICSTIKTSKSRNGSSSIVCSPRSSSGPKSVVLSFDDTISKLTMEDQRSCSTETLNTLLERRDTIAAIVRAQARGGWRAMAQEEAEAKAEELSRFGIEHAFTEGRVSPPNTPDENVIIVRHKLIPDPKPLEEQQFEDIQPNFFSSQSSVKADAPAEGRESNKGIEANTPMAFMSKKSRFLRPFHRKKKKDTDQSDSKESERGRRSAFLKALTPPRMSRYAQPQPGSPTSTAAPSTAPSTGTASVLGEKADHSASNSARRDGPKGPAIFEEVEVLERRREPVYSSYTRTPSYKVVEDVEILRKESDLSTLKQRGNTRRRFFYRSSLESVGEETISRDYDPAESSSRRESESESSYLADFAAFEEDEDHYTTTEGASVDSSLKTMTSWLAKELEETEQLRRILEEKEADFGFPPELLQSNESNAEFERVHSLPNAETLVQ